MATLQILEKWVLDVCLSKPAISKQNQPQNQNQVVFPNIHFQKMCYFGLCSSPQLDCLLSTFNGQREKNRKVIPTEEYMISSDGLKYYDFIEGKGPVAEKGSTVQVHFDCIYCGITAISRRESKILAGNRIIAQPYIFKVGAPPGKERKHEFVDNANGLFSPQAAPKPPPAMYSITEGMKVGGKRTMIVPPEAGYPKGMNEIPPGALFDLNVELLQVLPPDSE